MTDTKNSSLVEILKGIVKNLSFKVDYNSGNIDANIKCDRAALKYAKDNTTDKISVNLSLDDVK